MNSLEIGQTRDMLLPKLISREIDVSDLDIKIVQKTIAYLVKLDYYISH